MDYESRISLCRIENYNSKMVDRSLVNEITPFIFSNNLESWPALNLWTPLFFKKHYGNLEFNVNPNLDDKDSPYLYDAKSYNAHMKLSDLIDLMSENKSCYLAQEGIWSFKNLNKNYNFTNLIPPNNLKNDIYINLWMGANTRSGLHFDNLDNFLAQIYGIKKVILISPDNAKFVYPILSNFYKSRVNPFEPNFTEFPKLKRAKIYEGELKPGDILFIPRGWYHYIYSPQQSISLNCWYGFSLTLREFLLAFYRSGWKVWATCIKDFIWHGILSRPFEAKLYSGIPMGKMLYDSYKMKARQLYHNILNYFSYSPK